MPSEEKIQKAWKAAPTLWRYTQDSKKHIAKMLRAVLASEPVKVREMEWERRGADWYAGTVVGQYAVGILGARYIVILRGMDDLRVGGFFETPEDAKAAAQADYDRRIRSAIQGGA